jgi:hypothetical protein
MNTCAVGVCGKGSSGTTRTVRIHSTPFGLVSVLIFLSDPPIPTSSSGQNVKDAFLFPKIKELCQDTWQHIVGSGTIRQASS